MVQVNDASATPRAATSRPGTVEAAEWTERNIGRGTPISGDATTVKQHTRRTRLFPVIGGPAHGAQFHRPGNTGPVHVQQLGDVTWDADPTEDVPTTTTTYYLGVLDDGREAYIADGYTGPLSTHPQPGKATP